MSNENHTTFNKSLNTISKQSGIILLGKFGFQVVTFASGVLLARVLGASLLGHYQLGLVTIQILSIFCMLGFDRGLVRFIPIFNLEDKGKTKKLLQNNLTIVTMISFAFAVLLYFSAPILAKYLFHSDAMVVVLKLFSFYVPVFALFSISLAALRGFKRADFEALVDSIISPISFFLFIIILLVTGGRLLEVIGARIIARILGLACILFFMLRNFSVIFHAPGRSFDLKKYFAYSFPLLLISLIYIAIGKINIIMLGYFLESDQVGIYSVLVYISTLGVFGLQAVNAIFAPYISELYQTGDLENMEKLLKVLTRWIYYFAFLVFALIVLLKVELLKIYGDSFTVGALSLVIMAFGELVNAFTGSTGAVLLMTGKQKWEVLNSISILVLNIICNIIFIPKFGIVGAALAFTVSLSSINILKLFETYKEFKIHPYNLKYLKGTIAILVAAVVGYFCYNQAIQYHLHFILVVLIVSFIVVGVTLFLLYLLKFDQEDRLVLSKIRQKFNRNGN